MSGVELKPIKEAGGTNILLPLGKTNLGRGSFFEIADKRVSRNHAVLEVEDGKIRVMPIHTNPTFFDGTGGTKLAPLTKDVWRDLKHGDRIALTPDEHIFEVVIDYRPIVQETQSPRLSGEELSPFKQTSPFKQSVTPSLQNNGIQNEKKENGQNDQSKEDDDNDGIKGKSIEKEEETSPATSIEGDNSRASTTDGKNATEEEEDKSKMEETKKQDGQKEGESKPEDKSTEGPGTVVYDDKEIALPVQKERALPAWMTSPPKAEAKRATAVTPAKNALQNEDTATPQKKGRGRPKSGAKATPQAKKTPSHTKARAKKYANDDDDDYLSEEEPAPKKSKTSRSQRGTSKVASYAEDDYDDLDEEWVASDFDDDDASDWEMESQSQSSKKGRGKGKSPRGKFVSPRKRGRRKKYAQSSDEEDWSEEEVYVPRPTKRRASSSSNSQPTPQRKRGRKARQDSDFSDEEEYVPKPTKRTPAKTKTNSGESKKDHDVSGEEDDDGDKAPPKKKPEKKKKLKSCQFGKRCYRKNPVHFGEYCHPGDPDYRSEGDEDEDDGRPECEYGTTCYRKNAEHNENYKHTKPPPRPKREAAQKVLKTTGFSDDEDDDEPNTYDYNDSFLNDDVSDSASVPGKRSDDSDWDPEEDSQDVRNLQKEAKEFTRNKKMYKT